MRLTEEDVDRIHKLEQYLRTGARSVGEMASYLGVSKLTVMNYMDVFLCNLKKYHIYCADLTGPEKRWTIE